MAEGRSREAEVNVEFDLAWPDGACGDSFVVPITEARYEAAVFGALVEAANRAGAQIGKRVVVSEGTDG